MDMNCSCTRPAELEGRRSLGRYDVISGVGEGHSTLCGGITEASGRQHSSAVVLRSKGKDQSNREPLEAHTEWGGPGAESGLLGRLGSLGEEMERAIRLLR